MSEGTVHRNFKSDLQFIWDSERVQDIREYFNEQDKLLQALFFNVVIQPIQLENAPENTPNTPNSEFENLQI